MKKIKFLLLMAVPVVMLSCNTQPSNRQVDDDDMNEREYMQEDRDNMQRDEPRDTAILEERSVNESTFFFR